MAQIAPVASSTEEASADAESASDPTAPRYAAPDPIRFRVGAMVVASRGASKNVMVMVAVPLECPEQKVTLIGEDISPEVANVSFRLLQGGANQMIISIPFLPAGSEVHAFMTAEVATSVVLPPTETASLKIPKRIGADLRAYVNSSPYIESKHRTIRNLAREILKGVDESATDWERVETIYDYVLDNIKYIEGPDKSALSTLRDKDADCQGRSALFIALCRASGVPARMVWVDGHAYPEFYLESADEQGHWYPCESAGTRAFGEMPLARTILQKGDNFRVPERKEKLRYASDYMIGVPVDGAGRPRVTYLRQEIE